MRSQKQIMITAGKITSLSLETFTSVRLIGYFFELNKVLCIFQDVHLNKLIFKILFRS